MHGTMVIKLISPTATCKFTNDDTLSQRQNGWSWVNDVRIAENNGENILNRTRRPNIICIKSKHHSGVDNTYTGTPLSNIHSAALHSPVLIGSLASCNWDNPVLGKTTTHCCNRCLKSKPCLEVSWALECCRECLQNKCEVWPSYSEVTADNAQYSIGRIADCCDWQNCRFKFRNLKRERNPRFLTEEMSSSYWHGIYDISTKLLAMVGEGIGLLQCLHNRHYHNPVMYTQTYSTFNVPVVAGGRR